MNYIGVHKNIKNFIADRHLIFHDGIKNSVKDSDIEIESEADNTKDLIVGLTKSHPHLLITSHLLYYDDAAEFLPIVKKTFPKVKILMLTMDCRNEALLKYASYIDGFICKSATGSQIVAAIQAVANGGNYYYLPAK